MHTAAVFLCALVACIHVCIFVLESFLWTTARGRRVFGNDEVRAAATKVLAQNQGVYNLFLAAGIFWGLTSGSELLARTSFFLVCVAAAGAVGAATAMRRILLVQTVPALLALAALWAGA